jgi:hypothetical protein
MALINLSVKHGRTLDEARAGMEQAVQQTLAQFGAVVQQIDWSSDRTRVRLAGSGFQAEMWVDAVEAHVTGDVPILGQLFAGPAIAGLKGILENSFRKRLT